MRLLSILLVLLIITPAHAAPSKAEELAGVTLPPRLPAPDELAGPAAQRLSRAFDVALTALDAGEWAAAARGFEALLTEVDWPEAAFDAALARYHLLDLPAALTHARRAAEGLPRDGQVRWLHAVVLGAVGRHQDAEGEAALAVAGARGDGDQPLLARSLLQLASAARLSGKYELAVTAATEAQQLGTTLGDPLVTTAAWLALGHARGARGESGLAAEAFAAAGGAGAPGADPELALGRAEAAWAGGGADSARTALAEALAAIDATDGIAALTRAGLLARAAPLQWATGDPAGAVARLDAAEAVLSPAGARAGVADIQVVRAAWAVAEGDARRAGSLLDAAIETMEGLQVPMALASARLARSQVLAEEGDVRAGLSLARAARDEFAAAGYADGLAGAWLVVAELLGRGGALADAVDSGTRALELARGRGAARQEAAAHAELAVILARLGAMDEASQHHLAATSAVALLSPRGRARVEVELARGYAHADRLEEALTHARRALEVGGEAGAPRDLVALAEEAVVAVLLDGGRHDDAEAFVADREISDPRILAAVADRAGTALYNEGVDAYAEGDYVTAVARFDAVAASPTSSEERRLRARRAAQRAFEASGVAHLEVGAVRQADADLAQAAAIAAEVSDSTAEARAHVLRAQIALDAGRLGPAADLGSQAAGVAGPGSTLRAEAWEIVGLARIDADPAGSRRAFEDALLAWGVGPESVARRATLTYNLAVLEQTGDPAALRARLEEVSALARAAGDEALHDEAVAWLKQLETP